MSGSFINDSVMEIYIFETQQMLEQIEQILIASEKEGRFSKEEINEIFRFMHTIKGSSSMMMFNGIAELAHKVEDLFFLIRKSGDHGVDFRSLTDVLLESMDFIGEELETIQATGKSDRHFEGLIEKISEYLVFMENEEPSATKDEPIQNDNLDFNFNISAEKAPADTIQASGEMEDALRTVEIFVRFQDGCGMENIRAYTLIHNLEPNCVEMTHDPPDVIDGPNAMETIQAKGFRVRVVTGAPANVIEEVVSSTIFVETYEINDPESSVGNSETVVEPPDLVKTAAANREEKQPKASQNVVPKASEDKVDGRERSQKSAKPALDRISSHGQTMISVHVDKLDRLMNLVGEMVISEAMVTQNPEVMALGIDSFQKSARQLHKITNDLQDMVMAIRMVPLSSTFSKTQRILRDISKKLGKQITLNVIGEETEVDKNIIEKIADPLMHIVRNAADHGIEPPEVRDKLGKSVVGLVTIEAKNSGSDVVVMIKDDGKGLNGRKLYEKAYDQGLIKRSFEDMTDQEIYNLILLPGFSTKEAVTEYSGRGVGMDVVAKNIEAIGGSVFVDSVENEGTTITLKIPLTLAIVEGMIVKVGRSRYTIPISVIEESFRPNPENILTDPSGNEMIILRGQCLPILRIHKRYRVKESEENLENGIFLFIKSDNQSYCIFADELVGQQQVVVKNLPEYIKRMKKIEGLAGCTLLSDGGISLILDASTLFKKMA